MSATQEQWYEHTARGYLSKFFGEDQKKIDFWLHSENLNLGASPMRLIQLGKGEKVLDFIKNAMEPQANASEGENK